MSEHGADTMRAHRHEASRIPPEQSRHGTCNTDGGYGQTLALERARTKGDLGNILPSCELGNPYFCTTGPITRVASGMTFEKNRGRSAPPVPTPRRRVHTRNRSKRTAMARAERSLRDKTTRRQLPLLLNAVKFYSLGTGHDPALCIGTHILRAGPAASSCSPAPPICRPPRAPQLPNPSRVISQAALRTCPQRPPPHSGRPTHLGPFRRPSRPPFGGGSRSPSPLPRLSSRTLPNFCALEITKLNGRFRLGSNGRTVPSPAVQGRALGRVDRTWRKAGQDGASAGRR